ncbi:MAG: glycosyltransferase, partial [Bacilli bacterium]|nr:glycosyltransferase [Bacilli bacterium]
LNNDDINEFIDRKLISRELSVLIPGIGIDCKSYNFNPLVPKEKKVLMLSRLIVNKGILDYCKIAREIRKNRPDISFYLYGAESQLTVNDIIEFINDKSIIYGGYSTGASKLYQDCRLYVSCSYREGFPRVILEAMASGCPVIAYNVTGSNAVIDNNDTGVLLEPKNIDAFCKEIVSLIDDEKRLLFFKNKGRLVCEKKYDSSIVNNIIYKEID